MASGIQDLEWFARESLLRGLGKPEIRKAMLEVGWTEDQVRNVMDTYADVAFPVPYPNPDHNYLRETRSCIWFCLRQHTGRRTHQPARAQGAHGRGHSRHRV